MRLQHAAALHKRADYMEWLYELTVAFKVLCETGSSYDKFQHMDTSKIINKFASNDASVIVTHSD